MIIIFVSYLLPPILIRKKLISLFEKYQLNPKKVVIVNNNVDNSNFENDDLFICITGSNVLHDISGYYEGVTYLGIQNYNYLFINDTIFTTHHSNLYFSKIGLVDKFIGNIKIPAISGYMASYRALYFLNPISRLNVFVSTFFLIVNRKAVDEYIKLYMNFSKQSFDFEPLSTFINLHLFESNFSINIVKKILNWDDVAIEKKRKAIFFEHFFSGEIGKIGALIPLNSSIKDAFLFYLLDRLRKYARLAKAKK